MAMVYINISALWISVSNQSASAISVVTVDFDTEDVTVFEREGVAEVCLKIDEPIGDPLVIELTTAEKTDTTDKADRQL